MALVKTGYIDAQRGTTKQKVATNEDGNIAVEGDTHKGHRYITISQANAANNLIDNVELIKTFLTFVGAADTNDSISNTMSVKWGVA